MTPSEFNRHEMVAGRFTDRHIEELVKFFQERRGLAKDGYAGPKTQGELDRVIAAYGSHGLPTPEQFHLALPLPTRPKHGRPVVTSSFRPADRPTHNGLDFFYHWQPGDPAATGDGKAAAGPDGKPKWIIPEETVAIAAAPGIVQMAGWTGTGYRVWIDHGNGLRTGYFHLRSLIVAQGESVLAGDSVGYVGHNPADYDAKHLHFELSPTDRYAPMDPTPYFE